MEKRAATFLATFRKKAAATLTELSVNRNDNLNSVICLLVVDTELLLCIAMIAQVCVWQLPRVLFFFLHSASNEPFRSTLPSCRLSPQPLFFHFLLGTGDVLYFHVTYHLQSSGPFEWKVAQGTHISRIGTWSRLG